MAYPTAPYSVSPVSNGDVIDAARDNAQDTELTALTDAVLNGLPHAITISTGGLTVSTGSVNIGGPSSLTTLQVNGASTFAGAVTFSTGATVSTGVIRQNSLPMWNVLRSTQVAMASGSSNGIAFDVQDFVRGSIEHSTATDSSRVTINTTGVYHLSASAIVEGTAGNPVVKLHVRQNDSTNLLTAATVPLAAVGLLEHLGVNHSMRIDSTCYLTCVIVSSGGAASTAGSSAASRAVRFSGHFLG